MAAVTSHAAARSRRFAGSFAPDRLVLMEFPSADEVVAFYFSDAYAPLLQIRLKATEPRFVLVMRTGALPDRTRRAIAEGLAERPAEALVCAGPPRPAGR